MSTAPDPTTTSTICDADDNTSTNTDHHHGHDHDHRLDPHRTLALWCPDWPFVAAGLDPAEHPAIVLSGNRVIAATYAARAEGVQRGMRRRDAQSRSPDLVVVPDDPGLTVRAFEPVVIALAELVPSVEVVRPGLTAIAVDRTTRYFGTESRTAHRLIAQVHATTGAQVQAGVADGLFAATLAAQQGVGLVPHGGTPAFLAPQRVGVLDRPAFTGLLTRLGIHTLGELAALPTADVHDRFGPEGAWAHRLASGRQERVHTSRQAPLELAVEQPLDPPVERVDAAAFVARSIAQTLQDRLDAHGLMCLGLTIEARTAHGEQFERRWRHDGSLSVAAIADRVRWQLDGWLTAHAAVIEDRLHGGLTLLRLIPEQVMPADGRQLDLLTTTGHADDPERQARVDRALTRVQGLLGHQAVVTAVIDGGRDPLERVRLVPWTDPRDDSGNAQQPKKKKEKNTECAAAAPWPGHLPDPAPSTVLVEHREVQVHDADGRAVTVSGRSTVSAAPARIAFTDEPDHWRTVTAWAGPWPVDSRWWDPRLARRRARFQLLCADGTAWLVVRESGCWRVEAQYD
jgi:protein ImuB